jgi:GWxTD domain-containing protein
MNALDFWIHSAAAKALGTALAHFVWEGAAIAVLLASALAVFRGSARVRYGLACAALVSMPIAFAVTLAMLWPHSVARLMPLPPLDLSRAAMPAGVGGASTPWTFTSLLPWAVPVWMAGVAAFLVYRFASWIAAQRLRRLGACAAPEDWSRRLGELAARLKISRHVALLESCLAEVPMLIGYLRPVILVPIGMLAALPIDQVEAILLHELAHIRRADYLVNLLQTAIESVLFYHPAVWWISSVVRAERENCCDDFVLARDTDPRAYAAALIALEQSRGAAIMALAANDGNLVRRVRRVLGTPRNAARQDANLAMGPVALAILGAGIAFAAWQPKVVKETPTVKSPVSPVANIPSRYKLVIDGPHPIAQAQSTPQRKQGTGALVPEPSSLVFSRWNDEVRYIITDQERAAWDKLGSDAEREKFIEQFWERRDPTPGTVENEYRDEHYRRIAYTNQRFSFADHAGSFSDRGRIYIMYGPPDEMESHPAGGSYQRPAEQGGGTTSTYPFEKWRYRWIEGIGRNVIMEFVDTAGNGEYRMSIDPSEKDAVAYVPGTQSAPTTPVQRFSRTDGQPVQVVAGAGSKELDRIRAEATVQFFRDELANLRAKYTDEHPDVQAMRLKLDQALRTEASLGSPGFNGKHSGVVIYPGGRVSFVVPLEGAGPFNIYGRITAAGGGPVAYFEEKVANSSTLNFVKTMDLKPGSYVFNLGMNGVVETATFEVK